METRVPLVRLIGSSLLALLAAASLVVAVLMFYAAWATGSQVAGFAGDVGTVAILVIAVLALAYAALAAYASLEEWRARPIGRMLGLVVAAVAVLAAATALLVGEVAESAILLYILMGLGIATAIPMIVPEEGTAPV